MKKFLLKTLGFAALVLVLAFGLDRLICRGLLKMDDYRFQDYSAMLRGGMDNDILIMGNSRGKSHFDTHVIDSVSGKQSFNLGIGGYPVNAQLLKYRLYREHNRKPALIIQNADYMTIRVMSDIRHQHESEQFFPLVYDKVMRKELRESGYGFLELNMPLYRFFGYQQVIKNGLMEALHVKHYSRPSYKGFLPEKGQWNGSELARMKPENVVLSEEGKALFEDYLAQCRADSIQVVLVNSPLYAGAREKLLGYDDARVYFEQVADKYGCLYLDYTDTPVCYDTTQFVVSVHLNERVARAFSETLMEDLKSLKIIE
jgi:hypothetical protein